MNTPASTNKTLEPSSDVEDQVDYGYGDPENSPPDAPSKKKKSKSKDDDDDDDDGNSGSLDNKLEKKGKSKRRSSNRFRNDDEGTVTSSADASKVSKSSKSSKSTKSKSDKSKSGSDLRNKLKRRGSKRFKDEEDGSVMSGDASVVSKDKPRRRSSNRFQSDEQSTGGDSHRSRRRGSNRFNKENKEEQTDKPRRRGSNRFNKENKEEQTDKPRRRGSNRFEKPGELEAPSQTNERAFSSGLAFDEPDFPQDENPFHLKRSNSGRMRPENSDKPKRRGSARGFSDQSTVSGQEDDNPFQVTRSNSFRFRSDASENPTRQQRRGSARGISEAATIAGDARSKFRRTPSGRTLPVENDDFGFPASVFPTEKASGDEWTTFTGGEDKDSDKPTNNDGFADFAAMDYEDPEKNNAPAARRRAPRRGSGRFRAGEAVLARQGSSRGMDNSRHGEADLSGSRHSPNSGTKRRGSVKMVMNRSNSSRSMRSARTSHIDNDDDDDDDDFNDFDFSGDDFEEDKPLPDETKDQARARRSANRRRRKAAMKNSLDSPAKDAKTKMNEAKQGYDEIQQMLKEMSV